jgi:hypothetical protein
MSAFEAIDIIATKAVREDLNTEKSQLRFLSYWWSNKYNKPIKDPLLQEYTVEELYYEYRLHNEYAKAVNEKETEEQEKIEEQKADDALAWAEAEEAKELAEQQNQDDNGKDVKITNEDEKWMRQQIEAAKATYGDSFGEDITEEFSDEW